MLQPKNKLDPQTICLVLHDIDVDIVGVLRRALGSQCEPVALIHRTDLLSRGKVPAIRALLSLRGPNFVVFVPDLADYPRLRLIKALAAIPRAGKRWLVDAVGEKRRVSRPAFVFRDLPYLLLDVLASIALWASSYVFVTLIRLLPARRPPSELPARASKARGKLRVALLRTDNFGASWLGGSFTHMRGFAEGVVECGHEVFLVTPRQLAGFGGFQVEVVPFPKGPQLFAEAREMLYGYSCLPPIIQVFRKERPDLVYHRHTGFTLAGVVLARLFRVPLVLEVNNSEVWMRRNWFKLRFGHLCSYFESTAFAKADLIVTVSAALKDDLVGMGVSGEKILVNPNGVNPGLFHPDVDGAHVRQRHRLGSGPVIGFLGTFDLWHGVEVLAEAIPRISARHPEARFFLIGTGDRRHQVERQVDRSGVGDRVVFAGAVPHHEVPSHLAACDILVSPHAAPLPDGKRFFGSPTKLFEYMAMGKPIVASRFGQIGEVLEDRVSALLVPPGDVQALVGAVDTLILDPDLGQRLGQRACEEAVSRFTWKQNAARALSRFEISS